MRLRSALIDTNFIVAPLVLADPAHARCVAAAKENPTTAVVTVWPVVAETMYFLHEMVGLAGQEAMYRALKTGSISVVDTPDLDLIWSYMSKYPDLQLDFADASLAALATEVGIHHIFTMDHVFRLVNVPIGTKTVLEVLS